MNMGIKTEDIHTIDQMRRKKSEIVNLRRWFHEHPEPSFKEYNTSAKIRNILENMGIEYQRVGETGTVGIIRGMSEKPVVGLRADIDALEIKEENRVPFRSQMPNMMHACGHDGHIAALLAAAGFLSDERKKLIGTVKLIFQPAEEVGKGAATIVESGLISNVDAFFGLHVTPELQTGRISIKRGIIMAGANSLKITIKGEMGHAALPHRTKDAIVAGCAVVTALQHIVARETNPASPAVVSVGTFHAGTRGNIIADQAEISGTVRIISEEDRTFVEKAVQRIVKNVAAAYNVQAKTECSFATGIVLNSDELFPTVYRAAKNIISESDIVQLPAKMTTDDFCEYGKIAPSFYALTGVDGGKSGDVPSPLHSGSFMLDEDVLPTAAALYVEFVHCFFNGEK